ncbi:MAG: ROK family protein [Actinomycetota bacterium]
MTRLAVGVDVGATKIAAGLVDVDEGRVLRRERVPTGPADGGGPVLTRAVAAAAAAAGDDAPLPVGVGICETVDIDGRITSAAAVDWLDLDVAGGFAAVGPIAIESDVRAAARAEAAFGAAHDRASALVVAVGTGISSCLVLDGRPWAGARGNAIIVGAPPIEDEVGGAAVLMRTGRPFAELLADPATAAEAERVAALVGRAVAALVNALDPAIVVLGGGIGTAPTMAERIGDAARPLIWSPATRGLPIAAATLGADAGLIGAALAAP